MKKLSSNFYIDLDGTVANFNKLAQEVTGKVLEHEGRGLDSDDWKKINNYRNFYFKLEPLPYANAILETVQKYFRNVAFLTAIPSRFVETAQKDKGNWCKMHFPLIPVIFTESGMQKSEYAITFDGKPAILLDDKKYVIDNWYLNGGYGIRHADPSVSILKIESLYEILLNEELNRENTLQATILS